MNNVYGKVRIYYEDNNMWQPIIKREWIEGFLRQRAWQGAAEKALLQTWHILEGFLGYLDDAAYEDIQELGIEDISEAMQWMSNNVKGFKLNKKYLNNSLKTIVDFMEFLASKKYVMGFQDFELVVKIENEEVFHSKNISGQSKIKGSSDSLKTTDVPTTSSEIIEKLIGKLGMYFQGANFQDDFQRALLFYTGPVNMIDDENDDFWIGFWDYFLFDYHLLENNETPVRHYFLKHDKVLMDSETKVLSEVMSAEFVVFYIKKFINSECVECVNLFTDETFMIPCPSIEFHMLKRAMFFGHVFAQDTLTVNYVNTIEVSLKLRQRIKDEVTKLKEIFAVQDSSADWKTFLWRHTLPVRHIIQVLTTQATVNVIPFGDVKPAIPTDLTMVHTDKVTDIIEQHMPEFGFSASDLNIAKRLWSDYYQVSDGCLVKKPLVWAVAVMFVYASLNSLQGLSVAEFAASFDLSPKSIAPKSSMLQNKLLLQKYDPRYLSDEGCLFCIYQMNIEE